MCPWRYISDLINTVVNVSISLKTNAKMSVMKTNLSMLLLRYPLINQDVTFYKQCGQ